eukprot:scaffold634_cov401-Prasinococcus_capsulatus_cf.AAC.5
MENHPWLWTNGRSPMGIRSYPCGLCASPSPPPARAERLGGAPALRRTPSSACGPVKGLSG